MAPNLRASFKERQCKCFFEALPTTPPPVKKIRSEVSREKLILDAPMVQVPPFDAVRSEQELVMSCSIEDTCLMGDGTLAATLGGDINEKDVSISPPSWEEIATLLKTIPCFTTPKPPASGVNVLFPLTRRHFVELPDDLIVVGVVHPFHGTPDFVLRCTYLMQKYIIEEMTEVVRFASFFLKFT